MATLLELDLAIPLPAAMRPKEVNIEIESEGNGRKQIGATNGASPAKLLDVESVGSPAVPLNFRLEPVHCGSQCTVKPLSSVLQPWRKGVTDDLDTHVTPCPS
jgi:hypothetical protein